MDRETRKKEIQEALNLIGWIEVKARISSKEDREIYQELSKEFMSKHRALDDKKLKRAGISL
jgi:hypothetical protein